MDGGGYKLKCGFTIGFNWRIFGGSMAVLNIGKVAKACDVSVQAIRYYEREGLLEAPSRTASGYRQYSSAAVKRLRFIRRAKELGFTLDEIRNLLAISDSKDADKS